MKTTVLRIGLLLLCTVIVLESVLVLPHESSSKASFGLTPQLIRQGPIRTTLAPSGYYWYQIGALGDASSQNVDGASITIRTVFDQVKNDAHSYWVGLSFPSGAFVQVGYLNGLSTTGQPYCCAWFFETFNTPSCDCPPLIGPEDSAGPIGSWHTYSMSYTGSGIWSFYIDGQLLGHSPASGPNFLGTGTANSGSCSTCAPAGIAEVAQAVDNTDVIGPAEFKDLTMHKNGTWQAVSVAAAYCCNGYSSNKILPISYGLAEIQNINNDYLAGTHIRPSSAGTQLWPPVSPGPSNTLTLNFIDRNGNPFSPDWTSLQDQGNPSNIIYYTKYQSQNVPLSSTGTYTTTYELWHGVNVAETTAVSDSSPSQTVQGNVFSVPIRVVGRFYSLPVSGATLLTFLPDSTNQTMKTGSEGNVTLLQVPPGNYSLKVTPPFGVPSVSKTTLAGPINISVSVFSVAELLTIVVPPIAIAVGFVIVALRREQARRTAMAAAAPYPMGIPVSYCRACGNLLGPAEYFCTTCGTPRSGIPPPPPAQQPPPPPVQAPSPAPSPPPSAPPS